jgi:hypothetical protein
MRYSLVLPLVALLCVGCGTSDPAAKSDPHNTITAPLIQPAITALVPNSVPVDSVSFLLTVNGSDFASGAVVFFNGTALNTQFVSSTQLVVQLGSANLTFAGAQPVYVRTQGFNSNTVDFNVTIQ